MCFDRPLGHVCRPASPLLTAAPIRR
jgi:hypothetical protein